MGVGDDFLLYLHRVKRVAVVHAEGICIALQPSNQHPIVSDQSLGTHLGVHVNCVSHVLQIRTSIQRVQQSLSEAGSAGRIDDATEGPYVRVDTADGVGEHGVKVSVTMENEGEQVGESEDGDEEPGLDGTTDEAVDDGIGTTEAGLRLGEDE